MSKSPTGGESHRVRRFAYNELGQDNPVIVTEDEIRKTYWPFWKGEMEKRLSEGISRAPITWEYALEDWITCNWAWEVDQDGQPINGVDHHGV